MWTRSTLESAAAVGPHMAVASCRYVTSRPGWRTRCSTIDHSVGVSETDFGAVQGQNATAYQVDVNMSGVISEWTRLDWPPGPEWRCEPDVTSIVDEAGMLNSGDLHTR